MENGSQPATKQDLNEAIRDLRDELVETIRDAETKLLKAFYTFAESSQKRLTENERDSAGVKERLAIVETRLTEVEKRLNMPPTA